jgi:hypothetical protein
MEGVKPVSGSVAAVERRVFPWEENADGGVVRRVSVDILNAARGSEQRGAWSEA